MSEKQVDTLLNVSGIIKQARITLGLKWDSELASYLGVARAVLSNWYARNSIDFPLLLNELRHVGCSWLLTGKGSPLHDPKSFDNGKIRGKVETIHNSETTEAIGNRSITLYDITAAANLRALPSDKRQYALGKILAPSIPACGGAVFVNGDNMYPIPKSGDIIGFKGTSNLSNVIYGEMYTVAPHLDEDRYPTVRYINHSEKEGHIKLISYSPRHKPMDLPVDTIQDMVIVKFSIRRNTMVQKRHRLDEPFPQISCHILSWNLWKTLSLHVTNRIFAHYKQ